MPKSASSTIKAYRLRVDGDNDERVVDFLQKYCGKFLLVHHVTKTENPHYHAYCESTLTQGNFSNKVKQVLEVSGDAYSNKSCAADRKLEYLSYLFNTKKGNEPRCVLYEGFSVIDVATYKETANTIAREFTTRLVSEKKTQFQFVELIIERVGSDRCCFPEVIYEETISVLKAHHQIARPFVVRDLISTVMAYSDNKQARNKVKEQTLKFFSS